MMSITQPNAEQEQVHHDQEGELAVDVGDHPVCRGFRNLLEDEEPVQADGETMTRKSEPIITALSANTPGRP